jgi:hypothetical protein
MYILGKWKMKIIIFCMVGTAWAARGEEAYRKTAFVETKVVDSFSVGVRDQNGFTNSAPDQYLSFAIWCTNGPARLAIPPQPEYAYKVELFDTNGIAITKTEMGNNIGSKFDDFDESALKTHTKINAEAFKKSELAAWWLMFRPSDLFEITKPGNYTLRIQFQILAHVRTGPNRGDYVKRIIHFPALDYPLVQPKLTNGVKP